MVRPKSKFPKGTASKAERLLSTTKDLQEYKRLQCIYFRAKNDYSAKEIADLTGYSEQTVRDIHSLFLKGGFKALKIKEKGGRYNTVLTEKEEKELIDQFEKESQKGGIVEVSKIHEAIKEKAGKNIAKSTTYRILDRHNWRKITPRPSHPKSSIKDADRFKKT